MNYSEAVEYARAQGWTLGDTPSTLPAKIAADRVARMIQERGQAIKAPAYGAPEYELLVRRGASLTLKSDPHVRSAGFWRILPSYLKAVEMCEEKFGVRA